MNNDPVDHNPNRPAPYGAGSSSASPGGLGAGGHQKDAKPNERASDNSSGSANYGSLHPGTTPASSFRKQELAPPISIRFDEETIRWADQQARLQGKTRSDILREALIAFRTKTPIQLTIIRTPEGENITLQWKRCMDLYKKCRLHLRDIKAKADSLESEEFRRQLRQNYYHWADLQADLWRLHESVGGLNPRFLPTLRLMYQAAVQNYREGKYFDYSYSWRNLAVSLRALGLHKPPARDLND